MSHAATELGPWLTLALLGAYHGLNPAMGWLFAVSRGLQERSGHAVARALPPIALGHAASVGATVALLALGNALLSNARARLILGALVMGFAVLRVLRPRHPRWVGMRLGFGDLTLWSFIMATAHGAGLMLVPVFLLSEGAFECGVCQAHAGSALNSWTGYVGAVTVHTTSMLLAAGGIAWTVYARFGLGLLRKAWFNLDLAWSLALLGAGAAALFG